MYNHNMKNTLLAFAFVSFYVGLFCLIGYTLNHSPNRQNELPDSTVYRLTKTTGANAGELDVYCLNGADATIRPVDQFGHIVVSCGK